MRSLRYAVVIGAAAIVGTLTTPSFTHAHGRFSPDKCEKCDHCVRTVKRCRPIRSIICSIRSRIHDAHCHPCTSEPYAKTATQKDTPHQKTDPVQKVTPTQKHDPVQKITPIQK